MSTTPGPSSAAVSDLAPGVWHLDPRRSTVEFHVRHFYGLMTVKGRFDVYEGTLVLASEPAVKLTIDASSLDTGHAKRDAHLRAADFFDVEDHSGVSFVSESAALQGATLTVHGQLHAAGKQMPVDVDATVSWVEGEPEIEAVTHVDHRAQHDVEPTWPPARTQQADRPRHAHPAGGPLATPADSGMVRSCVAPAEPRAINRAAALRMSLRAR